MRTITSKAVTVLLTSAGVATALNVIRALQLIEDLKIRIVAVDISSFAAGLHFADKAYHVPAATAPEYIDSLLKICVEEKVNFIFPLHSGEISIISQHVKKFDKYKVNTMLSSPEIISLCIDKKKFYAFLEKNNFNFPKLYNLSPDSHHKPPYPLFTKPRSGSSSRNTFKINSFDELIFYSKRYPDNIVQEFIEGREYTVDCLTINGDTIASIPRARLNVKDGKSMVGQTVDHPKIITTVTSLLKTVGMHGPCNVQCIENNEGELFIIEINPRLAAGGLPLTVRAGVNIPEMMIKYSLDHQIFPLCEYKKNLYMIRYLNEIFATEQGLKELFR